MSSMTMIRASVGSEDSEHTEGELTQALPTEQKDRPAGQAQVMASQPEQKSDSGGNNNPGGPDSATVQQQADIILDQSETDPSLQSVLNVSSVPAPGLQQGVVPVHLSPGVTILPGVRTSAGLIANTVESDQRRYRKRAVHNEVERRRKDKINAGILRIGELLPCTQQERQAVSKRGILDKAYDHIVKLSKEHEHMLMHGGSPVQAMEIKRLRDQINELTMEKDRYEEVLNLHGISVSHDPTLMWKGKTKAINPVGPYKSVSPLVIRHVKTESQQVAIGGPVVSPLTSGLQTQVNTKGGEIPLVQTPNGLQQTVHAGMSGLLMAKPTPSSSVVSQQVPVGHTVVNQAGGLVNLVQVPTPTVKVFPSVAGSSAGSGAMPGNPTVNTANMALVSPLMNVGGGAVLSSQPGASTVQTSMAKVAQNSVQGGMAPAMIPILGTVPSATVGGSQAINTPSSASPYLIQPQNSLLGQNILGTNSVLMNTVSQVGGLQNPSYVTVTVMPNNPSTQDVPVANGQPVLMSSGQVGNSSLPVNQIQYLPAGVPQNVQGSMSQLSTPETVQPPQFSNMLTPQNVNAVGMVPISACPNLTNVSQSTAVPRLSTGITNSLTSPILTSTKTVTSMVWSTTSMPRPGFNNIQVPGGNGMQVVAGPTINSSGTLKLPLPSNPNVVPNMTGPMFTILQGPGNQIILMPVVTSAGSGTGLPTMSSSSSDSKKKSKKSSKKKPAKNAQKGAKATDSSSQGKPKDGSSTQGVSQTTQGTTGTSPTTVTSQAIMQSGVATPNQSTTQVTSLPASSNTIHKDVNTTTTVETPTIMSTPNLLSQGSLQKQLPHCSLPANMGTSTSASALITPTTNSTGGQTVAPLSNASISTGGSLGVLPAASGSQVPPGQAPLMFPIAPLQLPSPVNHTSVVPTPTAFLTNQSSQFNQNLKIGGGAMQVPVGGVQLLSLPALSNNPIVPFVSPLQVNTTQTPTPGPSQNTQDILAKAAESIFSAQSPDLSSPSEQPLFGGLQVSQSSSTAAQLSQQTSDVTMMPANAQNTATTTSSNNTTQYHMTQVQQNSENRRQLGGQLPTSNFANRQVSVTTPQSSGTSMPFPSSKQHDVGLQSSTLSVSVSQSSGGLGGNNVNSQGTDSTLLQPRQISGHHVGLPKQVSSPHASVCPVPVPTAKSKAKAKTKQSESGKAKAKEKKGKSAGPNKSQTKGKNVNITPTSTGDKVPPGPSVSEGAVTLVKNSRTVGAQVLIHTDVSAIASNSNSSASGQTTAVFSSSAPVSVATQPFKSTTPICSVVTRAQVSSASQPQVSTAVQRTPPKNSRLSYSAEALIGHTSPRTPSSQEAPQPNANRTVPSPQETAKRPPNLQYNNLRHEATVSRSDIYSPEAQSGKASGHGHSQHVTNSAEGQGRDPVPSSQAGGFLYVPWLNRPTASGNQPSARPSSATTSVPTNVSAKASVGTRPSPVPTAVASSVQKSPSFSFFPLQPDLFNQSPQATNLTATASSKSSKTSMPPPNITPTSHLIQNKDMNSIRSADPADRVASQAAMGRWDGRNISSLLSPRLHPHPHQHSHSDPNTTPAASEAPRLSTVSKPHSSVSATGTSTVAWGNQGHSQRMQNQTNSSVESQKPPQSVRRESAPLPMGHEQRMASAPCRTSDPSTQLIANVQQRTVESNDQRVPPMSHRTVEARVNAHSGRSEQMEPQQRQERPRPSPQGNTGRQGPAKNRNNPWQGDQPSPAQANGHDVVTSQASPRLPIQSPQRSHAEALAGGRPGQQAGRPDAVQNITGRQMQITEQSASSPRAATANVTRNPQSFVASLGHPANNIDRSPRHHNGPMPVEPDSPSFTNQRPNSGENQAARKNKRQREAEEQQPKRLKPTENNQNIRSGQPVSEANSSRQKNAERPMTWTVVHREAPGTRPGPHHLVPQPLQDFNCVRTSAADINHGQVVNGHGREHLPAPHPPRLATSHDFFNPAFNIHPRGQDMHRHNIQPRAPFPGPDFQRDGRPHGSVPSTQHNPQPNLNTSTSFLPGMSTSSEASRPHSRAHEVGQFYTNFNPPKQVHGDVPLPTYLPNQVLAAQPPRLPEGRAEIATPFNPFSPPRPTGIPLNFSQNFPVVPDGNIPRTTFNLPPAVTTGPPANTLVNSLPPPPPPITPHVPNFGMFPDVPHNVAGPQNDNAALGVPQLPFHTSPMLSQAHGDPHHPGLRTGPLIGARAKESFMHSAMSIQNILGKGQHPPLEDPAAMNHGIGAGMGPSYHTSAFSNAVHAFNFPPP